MLSLLSWEHPRSVIGPLSDSGTGFREPLSVSALNEDVLCALESSWADLGAISPAAYGRGAVVALRRRAVEALTAEPGEPGSLVLGDPRISRLVPFWAEALERAGADARWVILLRNPTEVAASLAAWRGLSPAMAALVWLRQLLDAERSTRGLPRAVVRFEDLIGDWRSVRSALAERLGLSWPDDSTGTESALDRLIDPQRPRHSANRAAVEGDAPSLPGWVKQAYASLLRLCVDPRDGDGQAGLDDVRQEFDLAAGVFAPLLAAERGGREDAEAARGEAGTQAEAARREVRTAREHIEALEAESARTTESYRRRVADLAAAAAGLEGLVAAARVRESDLTSMLDRAQAKVAEHEQALAEERQRGEALAAGRHDLARRLRELQTSAAWGLAHRLLSLENRLPRLGRWLFTAPKAAYWMATLSFPQRIRLRRQALDVLQAGIFDADWYLEHNPDIAGSGWNPLIHWLLIGLREGRDPSAELHLRDWAWVAGDGGGVEPDALVRQWVALKWGPSAGVTVVPEAPVGRSASVEDAELASRPPATAGPFARSWGRRSTALIGADVAAQPDAAPIVLMIDSTYPRPDRDSGSVDAINHIHIFQRLGFRVAFAADAEFASPNAYLGGLVAEDVYCVTLSAYPSIDRFLELHGDQIAVCFLSRVYCGGRYYESVRRHCGKARVIFNTVDLHFLREDRGARLRDDRIAVHLAAGTRERELYLARASDAVIVVSDQERNVLEEWVPGARVTMLPLLREVPGRRRPFSERSGIGFVGGFLHEPNVDAVTYFLDEVWPLASRLLPGVQFFIIGSDLPESLAARASSDVVPVGYVRDLTAQLEALRLTVAPLRYGAGAKGKVASSLAHGVPCVATTVAVEGMGLVAGAEIVVADDPAEIAAALASVYRDEARWIQVSEAAIGRARQLLSMDRGLAIMASLLGELGVAVNDRGPARTTQA
jgi:hypothetical protein